MHIHRLGAYGWLLATPLFLAANVVTALAWRRPSFSWATNNISDLGNVTCGRWDTTRPREVCSPWHVAMNSAMIATGRCSRWGSCSPGRRSAAVPRPEPAQVLTLAGAGGYILAGAYPADVNENHHFLAALLIFVLANVGMLVAALARRSPRPGPAARGQPRAGPDRLAGTALFWPRSTSVSASAAWSG